MGTINPVKGQLDDILYQVAKVENIDNFEITSNIQADYGDGLASQFYKGDILNKDSGETTTVAIKKAPNFELENAPVAAFFSNENLFYSKILPALDALQKEAGVLKPFDNVPKYFCASMDPEKMFIAMQDLTPLGYVMFDKTQYLPKEHLEMIFKTYGIFHALSYVLRKKNAEKYQEIAKDLVNPFEEGSEIVDMPMTLAISAALSALDPENDKIVYQEIKDFKENVPENFRKSLTYNGEHRSLIHGDCWSNNMLFKYSESGELLDIKLIDFQVCKDNSPIYDLSYFFYSGAAKEDFDKLDSYLKIYHQSFSAFAKELGANSDEFFSFETLKNEWKENAMSGVFFGIYLWQLKLIPKQDISSAVNSIDKQKPSLEEIMKHWMAGLLQVHQTETYKEKTAAILRHAFEYGVLTKNKLTKN